MPQDHQAVDPLQGSPGEKRICHRPITIRVPKMPSGRDIGRKKYTKRRDDTKGRIPAGEAVIYRYERLQRVMGHE